MQESAPPPIPRQVTGVNRVHIQQMRLNKVLYFQFALLEPFFTGAQNLT